VTPYQTEQMLKHQDMQFEPRLVKSISQDGKYLLFNCQKVCPIKLITELRALLQRQTFHQNIHKKTEHIRQHIKSQNKIKFIIKRIEKV